MDDQCNRPVTPSLASQLIEVLKQMEDRRPQIEAALYYADGTHSYDDIVSMVMMGRLFWTALDNNSFTLAEVVEYPRQKHYHIFLAGGDLNTIRATQDALVNAAILAGCTKLTLGGRRGWIKALHQLGWREHCVVVAYDLSAERQNEQGRDTENSLRS